MSVTCERCLSARHFCRTAGCPCKRCNDYTIEPEERPRRTRKPRVVRERAPRRPQVGHHKLLGRSTLPAPMQRAIEEELRLGGNLSEIARRSGVSRDQVRVIRDRMARADQLVNTSEPVGE